MHKIITAIVAIFLLASTAHAAQTVTLTITHPTKYTDNVTALPLSAIQGYLVNYGVDTVPPIAKSVSVGAVSTVTINLDLPPRATPYTIQATAQTLTAVGPSDFSAPVTSIRQIALALKPSAPVITEIKLLCDPTCRVINEAGL